MKIIKNSFFVFLICIPLLGFERAGLFDYFLLKETSKSAVKYNYRPLDCIYPFVKYSKNLVLADSSYLYPFYKKLDLLTQEELQEVNILHIGDSHIQADMFSGKVRQGFAQDHIFGKSVQRIFFPYALAKTNNPVSYISKKSGNWQSCAMVMLASPCDFGLPGYRAITYDTNATFSCQLAHFDTLSHFNKVKIFHRMDEVSYNYEILGQNILDSLPAEAPIKTFVNIKEGYSEFLFSKKMTKIDFKIKKDNNLQTNFELYNVLIENQGRGISYSSVGVNGADAYSYTRSSRWFQESKQINPDLIVISLGTNDAYARKFNQEAVIFNFKKLIELVQETHPKSQIILTTPGDNLRYRKEINYNNPKINNIIKLLAKEYNCAIWDFYNVMGGLKSVNKWYYHGMVNRDKLHFTRKGYEYQGVLFYNALMLGYSQYQNMNYQKYD